MKIILNTFRKEFLKEFVLFGKKKGIEVIGTNSETDLFDKISDDSSISGFVLSNHFDYTQKAIDFIKKKLPYVPIVVHISGFRNITGADTQMLDELAFAAPIVGSKKKPIEFLFELTLKNIETFNNTFKKLQKLTAKVTKPIKFGKFGACIYDPTKRTLTFKKKVVKKMTPKEGGILEILGTNFGQVVKKDIILEKVWHKTDYFSGRSMDVYVTNLRKLIKKHKIPLTIQNITGSGLIME